MDDAFRSWFSRAPDVVASAPGRVNLMGEHTDYNGGAVLPTVIPQRTAVALGRRSDGRVVARRHGHGGALRDDRRQDGAAVVVGVLAHEVHAPRSLCAYRGLGAEPRCKTLLDIHE